jgi:hypothetical protein
MDEGFKENQEAAMQTIFEHMERTRTHGGTATQNQEYA